MTENTHYKLIYFPMRGRGEAIRWLFALAGVKFEEQTVNMFDWSYMKPSMPFGSLPILQLNYGEVIITQSITILRFLARKFGLAGKDVVDAALVDMYIEGANDLWPKLGAISAETMKGDMIARKAIIEDFVENSFKPFLQRYEKFLKNNKSGWLVGQQITIADVYVCEWIDRVQSLFYSNNILEEFPTLKDYLNRFLAIPQIVQRSKERNYQIPL